ncbi:Histidinol-phosphate aminotransferase [Paraburkholderia aspalathi]|uniref:histidinol-phosphate transaminase n=1 Tax=Paraburkholderia aspalathi TaxID=1324617 RepID=UPI00190AF1A0|nr:histidinol-phosphate transaminase [Paraburkholderia aspalathi]MBK3844395.1 histidinol-phosphate transaminase [Paraburkholderia aspalathi]CAE6872026.1 Histidinol-phosphate aminotransferase [Paraburkholderia aspalathi]CAE6873197.1 Histidinol-phosphate aminotransferase [Paraburkholderia aspalathi]
MDWTEFLAPPLRSLAPYRSGITEEKLRRERGLREIYKFSSNEAPFSPSPAALAAMQGALAQSNRYPDAQALLDQLAARLYVPLDTLILGTGSIDVISALVRAFVSPEHNVVLSEYGYCAYPAFVAEQGAALRIAASGPHFGHDVEQLLARVDGRTRMILVDSPTNLSGQSLDATALTRLVDGLPAHVLLILDEAYAEFTDSSAPRDTEQLPLHHPNVIVTRTFSKAYGLAGLRIGYGIATAGLIDCLNRIRPPFPASRVALAGAAAALDDVAHLERIVSATLSGRRRLTDALRAMNVTVFDGNANFVLTDFGLAAKTVYEGLLKRGFITRAMNAYGLPTHLRISVGAADEIEKLVGAIEQLLEATSDNPARGAYR